jgi:predicted nucleic acid-binding Zn ribbon protein
MTAAGERFRKANALPVGALTGKAVETMGGGPEVLLETLGKHWEDIVGASNARNSRPVTVADGVLTIGASSPVWMTQARFMKSSFIEKINRFPGIGGTGIRDILFTMDKRK